MFRQFSPSICLSICVLVVVLVPGSQGIVCKEFSPGGKFNLAKCRALQAATLETEASCSSEIRDLFNTCSVHSTSSTCLCVSSSQLFICHAFLDVESLKYYDCNTWERHVRRILKNDVTNRIQQLCKSQLKLIHSAQAACAKTNPTAPLRVCDILPNITTAKQLSCDELPAYAAYSLKNAHEVETNCLSKASALWAAKAACRTELTAQESKSTTTNAATSSVAIKDPVPSSRASATPITSTSTTVIRKKPATTVPTSTESITSTSTTVIRKQITCEDFSPSGDFTLAKCAALQMATLATATYCSMEIYALNNECEYGDSTSATCSCFATSQLYVCQSFFNIKSLKYYDCDTWERHVQSHINKKLTNKIRKLCKSEIELIQSVQSACAEKQSADLSLPVCEILPNITTAKKLSCDEIPAYASFSLSIPPKAGTDCLSKASTLWSAQAACATELTAQDSTTTTSRTSSVTTKRWGAATTLPLDVFKTHIIMDTTKVRASAAPTIRHIIDFQFTETTLILVTAPTFFVVLLITVLLITILVCKHIKRRRAQQQSDGIRIPSDFEDVQSYEVVPACSSVPPPVTVTVNEKIGIDI